MEAVKLEIGLKEPTFWTLLTTRLKDVMPLVTAYMTLGETTVQPEQLAEDRPSSDGKMAVN